MRRLILMLILVFMFTIFPIQCFAADLVLIYDGQAHKYTGNIFSIKVNGEMVKTDIPPVILENRSLVPVRAIFEKLGASVKWDQSSDKVTIKMAQAEIELRINSNVAIVNNKSVILDVPAKIINNRTLVPLRFVGEQLGMLVGWLPESNLLTIEENVLAKSGNLKNIKFAVNNNKCDIFINLDRVTEYNTMLLSNPDRIVIDLPNTTTDNYKTLKIDVNSNIVKTIRYAQLDEQTAQKANLDGDTVRVVMDVSEPTEFDIIKKNNQVQVKISEPESSKSVKSDIVSRGDISRDIKEQAAISNVEIDKKESKKEENIVAIPITTSQAIVIPIPDTNLAKDNDKSIKKLKNIEYHNTGDRVAFIINNAKLTMGGSTLTNNYTAAYDISRKKYTITFSNNLAELESGIVNIDDEWIDKVEVEKDSYKTKIIFRGKQRLKFNIFTREDENITAITVLKPADINEQLVVIDPGHGGTEVGAVSKGIFEKDLNLDISIRLNALLKEKGVKTYIIREDDSFVGLYERAYIANTLRASLFLSIHNNAAYLESSKGTETLYYLPEKAENQFNGKDFAQIIQNKLISYLKTEDRKIVSRPNLVVLKATTMTSALTEIAFMTNKEDLENLKKEEFKQRAAEALSGSILEALKQKESVEN